MAKPAVTFLLASAPAACPVASPGLDSGISSSSGGGTQVPGGNPSVGVITRTGRQATAMGRWRRHVAGAAVAAALCGTTAAWAQRNGDVRGGMDNQPTQGEVRSRERATGVAPPPAE